MKLLTHPAPKACWIASPTKASTEGYEPRATRRSASAASAEDADREIRTSRARVVLAASCSTLTLAALPYSELPAFAASLRAQTNVASRALEYTVLVAARPSEALGLRWEDVNLDARLIIIPAQRMKSQHEHRIPLASRVLQILKEMRGDGGKSPTDPVFTEANRPLGDHVLRKVIKRLGYKDVTPHGFRSWFKDWCVEQTNYPAEAAELALAHRTGNAVELAYRRGDLLQRRHQMMADWSSFVSSAAQAEQHTGAA